MNKYEINKRYAAILVTILVILAVNLLAETIYKPKALPIQRGFTLTDLPPAPAINNEPGDPLDLADLIAKASIERGKQLAKKCISCHTFEQGQPHKIGPNLWGVAGREIGALKNYNYSAAFKNKKGNWDQQNLFTFLRAPQDFVPGTKMFFLGFQEPQDVADVILYLSSLNEPCPAPS